MNKTDYYNGNPNIKKSGVVMNYTKDEIAEYIKCSKDPVYFIRTYAKIISLDEGLVSFDMRDYQERMIRDYDNHRFCVTLTSRQTGKCVSMDTKINICRVPMGGVMGLIHIIYSKFTNR